MRMCIVCFNPCFIGLASATPIPSHAGAKEVEFQSLFYWISLCNNLGDVSEVTADLSFNPCFIGLASATSGI